MDWKRLIKGIIFYTYHATIFSGTVVLGGLGNYRLLPLFWEAIRAICIFLTCCAIVISVFGGFRSQIMEMVEKIALVGNEFFETLLERVKTFIVRVADAFITVVKSIFGWHKVVFEFSGFSLLAEKWRQLVGKRAVKEERAYESSVSATNKPLTSSSLPSEISTPAETDVIKPIAILGILVLLVAEGGMLCWLLFEVLSNLLRKMYLNDSIILGFSVILTLAAEFIILFTGERFIHSLRKVFVMASQKKTSEAEYQAYFGNIADVVLTAFFLLICSIVQVYAVKCRVDLFKSIGHQPPYILRMLSDITPVFYLVSLGVIYLLALEGGIILNAFSRKRKRKQQMAIESQDQSESWFLRVIKVIVLMPVLLLYLLVIVIPTFVLTAVAFVLSLVVFGFFFLPVLFFWLILKSWQLGLIGLKTTMDILTQFMHLFVAGVGDLWPFKYLRP